jgi:hypothetical protein
MQGPLPASPCWQCGAIIDGATTFASRMPKPGDVSVCVYCSALAVYTAHGLRRMTKDERDEARSNPAVRRVVRAVRRRLGRDN